MQTLTIKPKDLFMHATLRGGIDPVQLEKALFSGGGQEVQVSSKDKKIENITVSGGAKKPMSIFYGSNTGTCEALAQTLANAASSHGYSGRVAVLDAATDALPHGEPVVIITASYEGEPADNAAHFMQWLRNLKGSEIEGVQYAVFGCGHRKYCLSFLHSPVEPRPLLVCCVSALGIVVSLNAILFEKTWEQRVHPD